MRKRFGIMIVLVACFLGACGAEEKQSESAPATESISPVATETPTPEPTSTPTLTTTATPSPTEEITETPTPTETPEPTATATPEATATPKPTKKPKPTKTPAPTKAPTPTKAPATPAPAKDQYTFKELDKKMYVQSQVNVRDLPATSGNKITSLGYATEVKVTGQCNENQWYRVEVDGKVGYCHYNYLKDTKPTLQTDNAAGTAQARAIAKDWIAKIKASDITTVKGSELTPTDAPVNENADNYTPGVAETLYSRVMWGALSSNLMKSNSCSLKTQKLNEVWLAMFVIRQYVAHATYCHTRPAVSNYGLMTQYVYDCWGATRTLELFLNEMGITGYKEVVTKEGAHMTLYVTIDGIDLELDAMQLLMFDRSVDSYFKYSGVQ